MSQHSETYAGLQHMWSGTVAADIAGGSTHGNPKRYSHPLSPASQPAEIWSNSIETWIGGIASESQGWNCPQETVPSPRTSTHFKCLEPGFTPPGTVDAGYAPLSVSAAPLQSFSSEAWPGMWPVSTTPGHGPFSYPDSPESLSSGARTEGHFSSAPTPQDQPCQAQSNPAQFFRVPQHIQHENNTLASGFDVAYGTTRLPATDTLPGDSSTLKHTESLRKIPCGPAAPPSPMVNFQSEFDSQSRVDRSARRASLSSIKTKTSTSQKRLSKSPTLSKTKSGAANFINYTPNDSEKIVTSVTPSGSSKTTARRGKEAAERRKNLISSIVAAVWELDQFLDEP